MGYARKQKRTKRVEAFVHVTYTADVVAHLEFLEIRAVKVIREATSREVVLDFASGWFSRRTADTSDKGTWEIMRSGE